MLKCSLLLLCLLPLAVAQFSPASVEELLPSAEKTALLYHLSYLSAANFPNLENIIRSRAVETQMLFMDSDATMLRCALTSGNLVELLFPMVLTAAENNMTELAVDHMKKAQGGIKDIINDVDRMMEKYDLQNKDVASSISDVMKEKHDTDARISVQSQELQQTENTLYSLKSQLQSTYAELDQTEQKQKQWQLQLQIADWQMKAAKDFDRIKSIPDPIHLQEVQNILTRIQPILIQLRDIWEGVSRVLGQLEQNTFAWKEPVLQHHSIRKDEFISSIQAAEKAWSSFGDSCKRASAIFRLQTKDAYKFLEVSPSSLSKEQWQEECGRVKARLENFL